MNVIQITKKSLLCYVYISLFLFYNIDNYQPEAELGGTGYPPLDLDLLPVLPKKINILFYYLELTIYSSKSP